jgi:hypothetical protein
MNILNKMNILNGGETGTDDDHPRCDYCGLPAVCFGADLVAPKYRCPRHCRANRQFGGVHGPSDYLDGHMAAEGYTFPGGA